MSPSQILSTTLAVYISSAKGLTTRQSSSGRATVDLTSSTGQASFLGSGFIYGWQFHASRAGGAQIPALGWAGGGYNEYIGRFNSTLSNYRTTRKYGGYFILLPHDLWGADGGQSSESKFPGDNGNWTEMEVFFGQLVNDLKDNDMLEGLVVDLWNEPDLTSFWNRTWDQYLEYYVRAHRFIRAELPGTLISGPSAANAPSLDLTTWSAWMDTVAANDIVPDIYSWHQIGEWQREPDGVVPDFNTIRNRYNLPERPIDLNEYAWPSEQNPGASAFYLAQLERHNLRGLRANWGSGSDLHNFMADLLFQNADETYSANGEWQLYNYYAQMDGGRLATAASADIKFDIFATVSGKDVKIIAGTREVQSTYEIGISGMSHLGLPADGRIEVRSYRFDWAGKKAEVGSPIDLGLVEFQYSSDNLVITVTPPTNATAFAFEFSGRS
ncbi:glycoside hydrolase superfamily [Diaporthe sp. PMI_573]|nr:glycoside hydrolase superfamily [Diaporthaceae sp. PMI_573]